MPGTFLMLSQLFSQRYLQGWAYYPHLTDGKIEIQRKNMMHFAAKSIGVKEEVGGDSPGCEPNSTSGQLLTSPCPQLPHYLLPCRGFVKIILLSFDFLCY